jgi:hypothetical protein
MAALSLDLVLDAGNPAAGNSPRRRFRTLLKDTEVGTTLPPPPGFSPEGGVISSYSAQRIPRVSLTSQNELSSTDHVMISEFHVG